ncbi:hypothetical protein [Tahibacter caeni]|uniref:hypothetical protein n=1 Tax=Tahibacter caeni TaxID=1453545 RepID=UPI002148D713|nr:hypothetical protein [Tahibacter caeni]
MELSAVVAAFTQIVSLMADYAGQKSSRDALSVQEFTEWMATHGHADLMRAIERNQAMTVSVKAAFAEGRDELLEKLRVLDEKITAVAAGLGPLDDMARAIYPETTLSTQARELLVMIERNQAGTLIETSSRTGRNLWLDGSGADAQFRPSEPRFYDADLTQLVESGLLSLSHNKSGDRVFRPTRLGAQIGKQLLNASAPSQ